MKNVRFAFERFLIVLIFAILFFSITEVSLPLYATINISVGFLLIVKFEKKRMELCSLYGFVAFAATLGFFGARILKNGIILPKADAVEYGFLALLCLMILTFCIPIFFLEGKAKETKKVLMKQQKYDRNRILQYIKSFDIIGVNGVWGSGKSFITDDIMEARDISEQYIFVKIDLLSCHLDQIHSVIFDSIARVLASERVFSTSAKITKKFLTNMNMLDNIYSLLVSDEVSYSDALNTLKGELQALDKDLIIVYEDIDRIADVETIKRIFSISEQLVCDKVKVMYQYDGDNLEKIGFNREYVEKYIPYVVNLTPIHFSAIIKHMLTTQNYDSSLIVPEDFIFISIPTWVYFRGIHMPLSLDLYGCSIRKVKLFLNELMEALSRNKLYQTKKNKQIAICFFIIKHFYHEFYQEFAFAEPFLDTIQFQYDGQSYGVEELLLFFDKEKINTVKSWEKLNEIDANRIRLFFLKNFGFEFQSPHQEKITGGVAEIYGQDIHVFKQEDKCEQINRLIWYLMYAGKSEYTNQEHAVNKFITHVLDAPLEKQKEVYRKFDMAMFRNDLYKGDNSTIFTLGLSNIFSMFKAFYVVNPGDDNWMKLIDFYIPDKIDQINSLLIGCLKYCVLSSNAVYLHVLKKFNNLPIVGNFNNEKYYLEFLQKYLEALSSLGYISTEELFSLNKANSVKDCKEVLPDVFQAITEKLTRLKATPVPQLQRDIDVILAFIQKNQEIISYNEPFQEPSRYHTSYESKRSHQEEYDRLLVLKGKPEFLTMVEESYQAEKISPYEMMELTKSEENTDLSNVGNGSKTMEMN